MQRLFEKSALLTLILAILVSCGDDSDDGTSDGGVLSSDGATSTNSPNTDAAPSAPEDGFELGDDPHEVERDLPEHKEEEGSGDPGYGQAARLWRDLCLDSVERFAVACLRSCESLAGEERDGCLGRCYYIKEIKDEMCDKATQGDN